jgi:hypothetical protein
MKNGKSGSGAAAAEVENAIAPIASAPIAAAASFDDFCIGRPLSLRPVAPFSARRCPNQYRSTVSGRLHEVAKMVSSR